MKHPPRAGTQQFFFFFVSNAYQPLFIEKKGQFSPALYPAAGVKTIENKHLLIKFSKMQNVVHISSHNYKKNNKTLRSHLFQGTAY